MGGGNERKKARKQAKKDARKARQEMARQTQMFERQLEAQRAHVGLFQPKPVLLLVHLIKV